MNARREWAQRFIDRAPNPPAYNSPEFLALPEGHPAKIAAVVVAAECWAVGGDNLEADLRIEVMALSRANKRAEDEEYAAQISAPMRSMPDPAEIEAEYWDWIRGAA